MKGLQLTRSSPDASPILNLTDLPTPTLKPGYLLVRVHASAIHPSDILNAKGAFGLTKFPRIPGRDFSGVIVEPESRKGEEVYGTSGNTQAFTEDGCHAEFILVPENGVANKPKNLSWVQAAVVGVPFTTAALALKRTSVKEGETVLVFGANGSVGSAVVQLAKSYGARVLSVTRNDDGDVNTAKDPELAALDQLTEGKGVDVVIDTVGQPALTRAAVGKMAKGGRLGFIAAPRSGSTDLGIEMVDFYRKEKTIVGINSLEYGVEYFAKEMGDMTAKFEKGSLTGPGEGEWTETPLEDAILAYEKSAQRGAGKYVLIMV